MIVYTMPPEVLRIPLIEHGLHVNYAGVYGKRRILRGRHIR